MEQTIVINGIYEHYSGKKYKVLDVVRNSEDLTLQVIYEGLYQCEKFGDKPRWCRPLRMFTELVEIQGSKKPRFRLLE